MVRPSSSSEGSVESRAHPVARGRVPSQGAVVIRVLFATVLAAFVFVGAASAASESVLHKREHRQVRSLHRWQGTVRFFRNHPRQAHTLVGRRETRKAMVWVKVLLRELAETRAQLAPRNPWPDWWLNQAMCIHSREGAWNANTGNGYWGGMQFLPSTWYSVGGSTPAYLVSPREQLYRAYLVWKRDGGSWAEWGTAGMCGLA